MGLSCTPSSAYAHVQRGGVLNGNMRLNFLNGRKISNQCKAALFLSIPCQWKSDQNCTKNFVMVIFCFFLKLGLVDLRLFLVRSLPNLQSSLSSLYTSTCVFGVNVTNCPEFVVKAR